VGLDLEGRIDLIVCNPPYISTARLAKDRAPLLEREPVEAFDGGPYGLSIHQRVIKDAPRALRSGGKLLFEIGLGQERQIKLLFGRAPIYKDVHFVEDVEGRPRVAVATRRSDDEHQTADRKD
jgi:release factor glutamine methyltransferase